MSAGQAMATAGKPIGERRRIAGGALVEADQLWPPSKLSSVNTSKKLLTRNWPGFKGSGRELRRPTDCLVGLSRIIIPGGSPEPLTLTARLSISVVKYRTLPTPLVGVIFALHGAVVITCTGCDWPGISTSNCNSVLKLSVTDPETGSGFGEMPKIWWLALLMIMPWA